MNIKEFRAKYPDYNDMSDAELSGALYNKYYSDMPRAEFDKSFLGEQQPAADPSQPQEQPGVLDKLLGQVKKGYLDSMVGSQAAAQGIPGIGTWTDELAGQAMSKMYGGTPEENRKAYMAPVEAMPAWRRNAAELVGGVAGGGLLGLAAPATIGFVPGLATATALGAAQGAGANNENRLAGAESGAVAGAIGGAVAPVVTRLASGAASRLSDLVGRAMGRPANPYLGKGGANAAETIRESVKLSGLRGEPPVSTSSPLLAQPAGATAAREVLDNGGDAAAKLAGAAKKLVADKSALEAIGNKYQDLGIAKLSKSANPSDLMGAPRLKSPEFDRLSQSPDVKSILKDISKDPRFDGVPLDSANVRHYVNTTLREKYAALKKSGKKPAVAGRVGGIQEKWAKAIDETLPGYSAVASEYRDAAQKRAAEVAAANLAGAKTKLTQPDAAATPMRTRVAQSTSGSLAGAQTRLGFNLAAAVAERLGLSSRKQTMEKIAAILTETDPKKIDMAIKMMTKDMSGEKLRPLLNMQGDNLARAWARGMGGG